MEDFRPRGVGRQVLLRAVDHIGVDAVPANFLKDGPDPIWSVPRSGEEMERSRLVSEVGLLFEMLPAFFAPPGCLERIGVPRRVRMSLEGACARRAAPGDWMLCTAVAADMTPSCRAGIRARVPVVPETHFMRGLAAGSRRPLLFAFPFLVALRLPLGLLCPRRIGNDVRP